MRSAKASAVAVGILVVLATCASFASARNLSFSSQTLRSLFREVTFSGGFGSAICAVTLEGSLHSRTFAKVAGTLIGFITRALIQKPCARGDATVLSETLPWHYRYAGFNGTLPNISFIIKDIVGAAFSILETAFGIPCLGTTTAETPATARYNREGRGVLTSEVIGGTIPTRCGLPFTLNGTSTSLTSLNSTARITLTLI
jgi:hypothetical protein